MALPPLSPIQHLAIRYLAGGWSMVKTAEELKLPPGEVRKWTKLPHFASALQAATIEHAELLTAMLLHGEREAAQTLIDALKAETKGGAPAWTTRITAAMNLLDRSGKRGKAIDRQQVASVTTEVKAPEEIQHALRAALRDPGVRAWLKESGGLPALISGAETADTEPLSAPVLVVDPDQEKIA